MAEKTYPHTTTRPANSISFAEWESHVDPVEVINGEIIPMSPPKHVHTAIMRYVFLALIDYIRENPIGEVWPDNTTYVLDGEERENWIRGLCIPDVSFISKERMDAHRKTFGNKPKYLHLSPDLAVEIVSEYDRYSDITRKIADYLEHGTQLVWIIDPQTDTIRVYTTDHSDGHSLTKDDTLTGDPLFPNWQCAVKTILNAGDSN